MSTSAKPHSISSPTYFWEALEQSQLFVLFPVFGAMNNFRFAIHKKTGRSGMIWFSLYRGEWLHRQGLIVSLSMKPELEAGYKIPRLALEAMEGHRVDATQSDYPTIEKTFLPEEVKWAIERLEFTLLEGQNSREISDDAALVDSYIRGDGRYMKLLPKGETESESSGEPSTFEQLEAAMKQQREFASQIFSLWHGPVSKLERARFASLGRDGELTLNLVDACSPHLEAMRKETTLAKKQVEAGETSYEQVLFGPDGFKARLEQIVGYGALHPALQSEHAYDWVMSYFLKRKGYR